MKRKSNRFYKNGFSLVYFCMRCLKLSFQNCIIKQFTSTRFTRRFFFWVVFHISCPTSLKYDPLKLLFMLIHKMIQCINIEIDEIGKLALIGTRHFRSCYFRNKYVSSLIHVVVFLFPVQYQLPSGLNTWQDCLGLK